MKSNTVGSPEQIRAEQTAPQLLFHCVNISTFALSLIFLSHDDIPQNHQIDVLQRVVLYIILFYQFVIISIELS